MKSKKLYYTKKRENPQLGTYYVAMGQLSKAAARRAEDCLYGSNVMLGFFNTEAEYMESLEELKKNGAQIQ